MRKPVLALAAAIVVGVFGCASKEKTGMKIYVQQKLYDKAIIQGGQALAQNPNDGDTNYFMGAAYLGKDTELDPEAPGYADSSEIYLTKAYSYFTKAKELAEAAWGMSIDDNITSMFGRHYNLGVMGTKQGDNVTAATEYRLATIADPKNYQGYYARAAALWALAQDAKEKGEDAQFEEYANAILVDLDKVVEIGTDDKEELIAVYQTKGDVLYMLGRLDDAQAAYTKAVQLSPENYTLMLTMANRFYNEQDWQNAATYYQDALSVKTRLNVIDERDAENYSALGNALSLLERRPEAIDCFKKVLELKPNDPTALYNMMVTHYKTGEAAEKGGDTATAKQHYNQAIELGNQLIGMDPKKMEYWQVRGFSKRGVGDTAGAARDLTEYKNLRSAGGQ